MASPGWISGLIKLRNTVFHWVTELKTYKYISVVKCCNVVVGDRTCVGHVASCDVTAQVGMLGNYIFITGRRQWAVIIHRLKNAYRKWNKQKVNPKRFFSEWKSSGKRAGLGPQFQIWPVYHWWSEMRWETLATKLINHKIGEEDEGGVPSSGQIGQHSPDGMMGSAQSDVSSQITSSHMMLPLSQMQIWQGSGFHTSLSL